jgi:hypothetical protein
VYACVPAWSIASEQAGLTSRAFLFRVLDLSYPVGGTRTNRIYVTRVYRKRYQSTSSHSTSLRSILIIYITHVQWLVYLSSFRTKMLVGI